jgi:Cu+-exporting ATPase
MKHVLISLFDGHVKGESVRYRKFPGSIDTIDRDHSSVRPRINKMESVKTTGTIAIYGMRCQSCVELIENHIASSVKKRYIDNILESFSIDIEKGIAKFSILKKCSKDELHALLVEPLISDLGFKSTLLQSQEHLDNVQSVQFIIHQTRSRQILEEKERLLQFIKSFDGVAYTEISKLPRHRSNNSASRPSLMISGVSDTGDVEMYPYSLTVHLASKDDSIHPALLYRSLQEKFPNFVFEYQDPTENGYCYQAESIARAKMLLEWKHKAGFALVALIIELVHCIFFKHSSSDLKLYNSICIWEMMEIVIANVLLFGPLGRSLFKRATTMLFAHQKLSMDALILLGVSISWLFSMIAVVIQIYFNVPKHAIHLVKSMMFLDTTISILACACIGRYLEALARGQTIEELNKVLFYTRPYAARFIPKDTVSDMFSCPASMLLSGDLVCVLGSEKIPIDGKIVDCQESADPSTSFMIDESMISGESRPIKKHIGDTVYAGTVFSHMYAKPGICGERSPQQKIFIRAITSGPESFCHKISRLLQDTSKQKSFINKPGLADRISSLFFPIILALALMAFLFWIIATTWLANTFLLSHRIKNGHFEPGWVFALKIFISVITISCPCLLGLVIPTISLVGVSLAAKFKLVMVNEFSKSEKHITNRSTSIMDIFERGSKITTVLFDKTGTLTTGILSLHEITWNLSTNIPFIGMNVADFKSNLCKAIHLVELHPLVCFHPIAKAIQAGLNMPIDQVGNISLVNDTMEFYSGLGICCDLIVNNNRDKGQKYKIYMGNSTWMLKQGINVSDELIKDDCYQVSVYVHVAIDESLVATLVLRDDIHPDTPKVIEWLHDNNYKTGIITGDNLSTAKRVALQIGIPIENVFASRDAKQKKLLIKSIQNGKLSLSRSKSRDIAAFVLPPSCSGFNLATSHSTPNESSYPSNDLEESTRLLTHGREIVIMIGDGINDNLALDQADIGIAFCRQQHLQDVAHHWTHDTSNISVLLASKIILFGCSVLNLTTFLDLSKVIKKRSAWTFFWACIYNLISIPIAMGILFPLFGIIIHPMISSLIMSISSLSTLLSVLNLAYRYTPPL